MKKIIITLCLFAATATFYSTNASTNTEVSFQRPPHYYDDRHDDRYDERRDDRRDDRRREEQRLRERYYEAYDRQERNVKRVYNDLNDERYNSRRYNDIKRRFYDVQRDLREIRIDAKRDDIRINQSKWETVRVR